MSAVLTSPMPVTRPKIHRLPASYARKPEPRFKNLLNSAPYLAGGAVVLALLAAIPPQQHSDANYVGEATLVPQISVTPQAALPEPESSLVITEAHAMPPAAAQVKASPAFAAAASGQTIVLQGNNNDTIVGQMARIPLENEQITEIKSASDIDNHAGRELLSIINKY